jgi:hypothetical protein
MKSKILKELKVQELIEGEVKDKDLILKILDCCKLESEFWNFIQTTHHRYGRMSYETHCFYSIKEHFKPLLLKA